MDLFVILKNNLNNTSGPITNESLTRIKELDGLRGISILLVVFFHYLSVQLTNNTNKAAVIIEKISSFGWVGVDFFFVISGFLICSILLKYKASKNFFSTFYFRRFVRIIPNYFLLLIVFMAITNLTIFNGSDFFNKTNTIPFWSYFVMVHNIFMANANSLGTPALSVTWSIGIEEQFYLLFPFAVYFFSRKILFTFLVFAIVASSLIRMQYSHWIPTYVLLPSRMDAISFGALIAFGNHYYNLKILVDKHIRYIYSILTGTVLFSFCLYYFFRDLGAIKHTLFAIIFSVLLLFALTKQKSLFNNLLRNKFLTWIGTISYSLYLFHFLCLGVFHHLFSSKTDIGIYDKTDIIITLAALGFSVVFSYAIYNWLEKPSVLIGKKFKY